MIPRRHYFHLFRDVTFLSVVLLLNSSVCAQTFAPSDVVLHVFQGGVSDGALPAGGVVFDAKGNLYGATTYGGSGGSNCIGGSCGTVYELSPPSEPARSWTETILYNFTGVTFNDGELPNGGPVIDAAGNLYGVTAYGGTGTCMLFGGRDGCGTVYELSPPSQPAGAWTKTTIYSFQGDLDGYLPLGNLTFDHAGNLYGATQYGGGFGSCNAPFYQYCGTVFELSPPKSKGAQWTEKVLYSFKGGADGANPNGGLIFDKYGAIYGTTYFGGNPLCTANAGTGCGTVFELRPTGLRPGAWIEGILYMFQTNQPDGAAPVSGLVADVSGNLYGVTPGGGAQGGGLVFRLSRPMAQFGDWVEILVYSFEGSTGASPHAAPIFDAGSLYGTTQGGGPYSAGVLFRLSAAPFDGEWSLTSLCDFPTGNQVAWADGTLALGEDGFFYGTAEIYDHANNGAVFKVLK